MVVHDGIDACFILPDGVDDAVWEAAKEETPELAANDRTRFGMGLKLQEYGFECADEPLA